MQDDVTARLRFFAIRPFSERNFHGQADSEKSVAHG